MGTFVDATGMPFPGRLLLGIAATGEADLGVLIGLAAAAAIMGDHVWYAAGRLGGDTVIRFYCRVILLEATVCVDKPGRQPLGDGVARHHSTPPPLPKIWDGVTEAGRRHPRAV